MYSYYLPVYLVANQLQQLNTTVNIKKNNKNTITTKDLMLSNITAADVLEQKANYIL